MEALWERRRPQPTPAETGGGRQELSEGGQSDKTAGQPEAGQGGAGL